VTYWYARHLRLPPSVPAHLSSTLASMGSALPYGIAAKLAAPDRPVIHHYCLRTVPLSR